MIVDDASSTDDTVAVLDRLAAVQYIDPVEPLRSDGLELQNQQHQAKDGGVDCGYR